MLYIVRAHVGIMLVFFCPVQLATSHWMFPKYRNRRTAWSSLGQFRNGTRRCLPLSHTTHKTTFHTTSPRLETGSHSTKFPLRDGGLSLCISFWKLNAFRKWNSEHSGQNVTQKSLLFTTSAYLSTVSFDAALSLLVCHVWILKI